ncbi:MAG TPA: hypothetical protein PKM73_16040 [Verrucomicrobiota bacterium]|nr:hypothetical protein [Verrucomicrobiota bacterium]HNU52860.1 hypothetical protein [Verrucomicrobiota bacterium]
MNRLLERTFWFSLLLAVGLGVLLVALLAGLGGSMPALSTPVVAPNPLTLPAATGQVERLFSTSSLPRLVMPTNAVNPFFTLHFQPPPPPPTKKIDLLYIGSFETSRGTRCGYVRLGENLLILTNGAKVVADHCVQAIAVRSLTLTNSAGQTNVLIFNAKKTLEVPAN